MISSWRQTFYPGCLCLERQSEAPRLTCREWQTEIGLMNSMLDQGGIHLCADQERVTAWLSKKRPVDRKD